MGGDRHAWRRCKLQPQRCHPLQGNCRLRAGRVSAETTLRWRCKVYKLARMPVQSRFSTFLLTDLSPRAVYNLPYLGNIIQYRPLDANMLTLTPTRALLALGIGPLVSFVSGQIAHTGDPVGTEEVYNNTTLYITGTPSDTAVVYLTDVFGIQLNENKLLADSFGRAGYLTVAPDLFNGTPAPGDINGSPDFNTTEFLAQHGPEVTDPIIATAIDYLRNVAGATKVVATGYCFGGRYTFRTLAEGAGADAGFAAHPSLLEDGEISAITGPASIAAADGDDLMPLERRSAIEALLLATGQPYTLALYGGTEHGFGVRANISDPKQKFGKEEAFLQAVRWFDVWGKEAA
ncbi:Alpha/Beta hydrolase protein [Xylariomycetidae sp. FL2044]|nr:Alpha/Beta hydrolase protein [Xylariomycetidae sp. FL2044]